MTESELAKLLISNPDLGIAGAANDHVSASVARVAQSQRLSEHAMQAAIIEECDRRAIEQPEWGLVAAIPNGQFRRGQRMEAGLRSGLPDLVVFAARHSRHGCFVELKIRPNDLSDSQRFWQRRLRVEGYICEVVRDDPQEAIDLLDWYLFR